MINIPSNVIRYSCWGFFRKLFVTKENEERIRLEEEGRRTIDIFVKVHLKAWRKVHAQKASVHEKAKADFAS